MLVFDVKTRPKLKTLIKIVRNVKNKQDDR